MTSTCVMEVRKTAGVTTTGNNQNSFLNVHTNYHTVLLSQYTVIVVIVITKSQYTNILLC